MFLLFTVVILLVCSYYTYVFQKRTYDDWTKDSLRFLCQSLKDEIMDDEDNFYAFQKYMMNTDRSRFYFEVEFDRDDYEADKAKWEYAFMKAYPNRIYGVDVTFDELSDELKDLFCYQYQEYWILRFEYYRVLYNSPYTYYIYPTGEGDWMYYIIDIERAEDENIGDGRMNLWDYFEEDRTEMPVCFEVWESGVDNGDIDEFHNEFGNTYSYYIPVYLNGEKMGLVVADMNIDYVNNQIWHDSLTMGLTIAVVIFICMILLIISIDHRYIRRIVRLNHNIEEYSRNRDCTVVEKIKKNTSTNDELSMLSQSIISMINQIHCHLTDMLMVSETLNAEKEKVEKLKTLSETDGLTRLNNKMSFLRKENEIDGRLADGTVKFAVIMFDLNYLKKINDGYGHEKGDYTLSLFAERLKIVFVSDEEKKCSLYRIGGDEFVAVVEDYTIPIPQLLHKLSGHINLPKTDYPLWEQLSVSIGYAEPDSDHKTFNSVLEQADKRMYENKKAMKAERTA